MLGSGVGTVRCRRRLLLSVATASREPRRVFFFAGAASASSATASVASSSAPSEVTSTSTSASSSSGSSTTASGSSVSAAFLARLGARVGFSASLSKVIGSTGAFRRSAPSRTRPRRGRARPEPSPSCRRASRHRRADDVDAVELADGRGRVVLVQLDQLQLRPRCPPRRAGGCRSTSLPSASTAAWSACTPSFGARKNRFFDASSISARREPPLPSRATSSSG